MSVKTVLVTLYVDDDNFTGPWNGTKEYPYQNITNALEHAIDGHTIFVRAGIYYENIVVDKSVSLVGEDRDSTIVDGNETGNVISITADNVSIENFTIRGSLPRYPYSGIFVEDSNGNYISRNTITNNYNGFRFFSSFSNVISGNTISSNNYDGIGLSASFSNVISGNIISSNNYDGIGLSASFSNVISGNTITDNYDGIGLFSSFSNVISGNIISSNNYAGLRFFSSFSNVISGNIISSNNYAGIYLTSDSSNNTIYHNNFNNTYQVQSDSTNIWAHGYEGNYWSDYNGRDLNGDGIGDQPYEEIDNNNVDNYPLMGMFSDFEFTWKEETHRVTAICNSTISGFEFEIGAETGNKIIRIDVADKKGTVGFCRVMIPTELMNYPFIVLVGAEEIVPTLLDVSNETYTYIYFTHTQSARIRIISSKTLHLYYELLDQHEKLQNDLCKLNVTYHGLLNNYNILLGNYTQLREGYRELNVSYQEHLLAYSKNVHNVRNLMYIFAAVTAIFLITTGYLSNRSRYARADIS